MVVRFLQPYYPNLLNGADTKQSWVQAFMQDLNKVNREANENRRGQRQTNVSVAHQASTQMPPSEGIWSIHGNGTDGKPQSNTSPINIKQDDSNKPPKSWASMVSKKQVDDAMQSHPGSVIVPPVSPVQSTSPSLSSSPTSQSLDGPESTATTASPQEDVSEKVAKDIRDSMGGKLLEFLHYFGNNFDYLHNGISIRDGGMYFRLNQSAIAQGLWIDDPISPGHNVALSTFNARGVLNTFRDAFLSCVRHEVSEHCPTILSTVIRSSPWLEHSLHYAKNCKQEMWDSRRRASPEDYELAAEEIRQEIRKLSLEKQRMSQKKKRLQRKAPKEKMSGTAALSSNQNESKAISTNNLFSGAGVKVDPVDSEEVGRSLSKRGVKKKYSHSLGKNEGAALKLNNDNLVSNRKGKHKNKSSNGASMGSREVKKTRHRSGVNSKRKEMAYQKIIEKTGNVSSKLHATNEKKKKNKNKKGVNSSLRTAGGGSDRSGPGKPTLGHFYFTGIARR